MDSRSGDNSECHVCCKEVGRGHKCKSCDRFVHLICGKPVGEEGYGQAVICFKCGRATESVGEVADIHVIGHGAPTSSGKSAKKRQLVWNWSKGCPTSEIRQKEPIPEKKQRLTDKLGKKTEKYTCLECLELSLKGKRDERFVTLCRGDAYTINRHKDRWHNLPSSTSCTIVPSTAPEISALSERFQRSANTNASTNGNATSRAETSHANPQPFLGNIDDENEDLTNEVISVNPPQISALQKSIDDSFHGTLSGEKNDIPERNNQTTLLSRMQPKSTESSEDQSLQQVVDAINALSLKVDDIGKQHTTLLELACQENDVNQSITALREAQNIISLADSTPLLEWFYDESTECAILRCLPCYQFHAVAKPTLANLNPSKAQRLLNPTNSGSLATGILLNNDTTRLLISGQNPTWYREKNACIQHLCLIGIGSKTHKKAMVEYKRKLTVEKRKTTISTNIFRAAIVDLKLGSAATHLETLISLLACCGTNVGNIGHGRNNFNDILYCLEQSLNHQLTEWLNTPLPSTLLPPHFWATVDKATPSRTTNQAVIIVAREKSGVPCPIPVAAPPVYTRPEEATYESLAEQLLQAVSDNFSEDVLSRLCGVAADGPYQASGFAGRLREALNIQSANQELAMPVTWDSAHLLNLAVTDVRDSRSKSGENFRRFVKRCNVFNHVLAHGKGFAFLQMVDGAAHRPVSYATQRFASSSYDQWIKIEQSYNSLFQAFDLLHPNRSEDEEWQYMIAGSDFVADLLAFLDIMEPVVRLMQRVQSLDTPVWKTRMWWPKVKAQLERAVCGDPEAFPRLEKEKDTLKAGGMFKNVTLLRGWMVTQDHGKDAGDGRFVWEERSEREIKESRELFSKDLKDALDKRINSVRNDPVLSQLEVFDASNLVKLQCGKATSEGLVQFAMSDGEYEAYGVEECKCILSVASKMPHIQAADVNFDPRMAHRYMCQIKNAVKEGVWNGLCPEWFVDVNTKTATAARNHHYLKELLFEESNSLDTMFSMVYSDGKTAEVHLDEQAVYQSFYSNKEIYESATPAPCALLDIVLAKGGPEAIAESFYNSMRCQQQPGGQSNETLARRTKISWCLPSLKHCDKIIHDAVALYHKGDDKIRPHRIKTFFSGRANKYDVSKVIDRVDAEQGRCPFLVDT